jgi:cardiolipin hydrolase
MSPYIMHHKFVLVDDELVISGSMNFTMTGVFCNWENVMFSSQPELVSRFRDGFQSLWEDFRLPLNSEPPQHRAHRKHQMVH